MRLLGRLLPTIVILASVVACQSPMGGVSAKTGPGTLTLSFATGARTVVAGWSTAVSTYAVHMTCPGQTTIDQSTSGTNSSMTVTSVGAGTWAITVTATNGAGTVGVGNGTVTVTAGSAAATTVSLSTTQSGTGSYSYTFAVPTSVGITSVTAQRYTTGYVAVSGASFTPTLAPGTGALSTDTVGTVAEPNITSGTYLLRLTFWRGSHSVGTFIEAINVWDNVTSDQWLDTTGTPQAYQLYAANNFATSDSLLGGLSVTGTDVIQYPAFSSATTTYVLSTSGTVVLAPTVSESGQTLGYQVDSTTGSWIPLASGTSTESVGSGHSVTVRVTAQDGSTTDYTISVVNQGTVLASFAYKSLSLGGPATLMVGQNLIFAPSFSGATNWIWTLNGATVSNVATYTFTSSSAGHYVICVTATLDGVLYSASTAVAVTDQGIAMLSVPGGTFSRDGTATNLSVVSPFLMSQFDITQDQYQVIMGTNPSSFLGNGLRPVEQVSWYTALVFCNTLSLKQGLTPVYSIGGSTNPAAWPSVPTGSSDTIWDQAVMDRNANGYRLPTVAEWQWAAMGATGDSYLYAGTGTNMTGHAKPFAGYNGSNTIDSYAWYAGNSSSTTHPVGTQRPNELGLYDLNGNVLQWCWNWYGGASGTFTNDSGPFTNSGAFRYLSGGCWSYSSGACGVASLQYPYPNFTANYAGFRVVQSNGGQYVPTNGLVGQWMLDGNLVDTSGSNPASPYNGTSSSISSTTDRKGNTTGALAFSGTSAVTVSNSTSFPFGNSHPFSLSVWFKPTSGAGNVIGTLGTVGTIQVSISLEAVDATRCNVFSWIGSDSTGGNRSSSSITLGTWHHAVLVFNGTKMTTYVDGIFVGSITSTYGSYPAPGTNFYIGDPYVGSLASCRLYNRALTAAEVTALYQE